MIDWAHVDELRADMGDSFAEIVEVFLQEVAEAIGRLTASAGHEALAADLHVLKGAALNLGFTQFAALCAAGETRAARGDAVGVDLAAIRSCHDASLAEFLAGLARRAA